MTSKRKLFLSSVAVLFSTATCWQSGPDTAICAYNEKRKQVQVCVNTDAPKEVHDRAKTEWGGSDSDLTLYVNFYENIAPDRYPAAMAQYFARSSSVVGYINKASDDKWKERSFKRMLSYNRLIDDYIARHKGRVEGARIEALAKLEDGLKALIAVDKQPLADQLEFDRRFYPPLTEMLRKAQGDLQALLPEFNTTVQAFKTYKSTETALQTRLNELSAQASAATIAQLPAVESQLFELERSEYNAHLQFFQRVVALNARLKVIQISFNGYLNSQYVRPRAEDRGMHAPDLVGSGARTLASMAAYSQNRDVEMSKVVAELIEGCAQRRNALINAQATEATRVAFANSAFLNESTKFLAEANVRINTLLGTWPKSTRLKLPFYSAQHDAFVSFLQLEPLCAQVSSTNSAWMQTGCNAYSVNFSRGRSFLSSLPNTISLYVSILRDNGAPAPLLASIQADLTAGNLRRAVNSYDAALRLVDGG